MNEVALSVIRMRSSRPPELSADELPRTAFQELLSYAKETVSRVRPPSFLPSTSKPPDTTIIQSGDCLTKLCFYRIKRQGVTVSHREFLTAVQKVAEGNHLADPDKIYPGQMLDLSALNGFGSRQTTAAPSAPRNPAEPWESLAEGAVALSSDFGFRRDPFTGKVKHHNGIDVVAPSGAAVPAVAAGSVIYSGWKAGYGNTVIIRHGDGLESLYGHISKSLVQVGAEIQAHSVIASVGSTGRSTGSHLHFEIRRNGTAMDPLAVLSGIPGGSASPPSLTS